jgi:hypothetical protein
MNGKLPDIAMPLDAGQGRSSGSVGSCGTRFWSYCWAAQSKRYRIPVPAFGQGPRDSRARGIS